MAEETTMTDTASDSSNRSTLMIIGIVIVIAVIAVAAYFIYQEYQDNNSADNDEKVEDVEDAVDEVEEEVEEAGDELSEEIQKELDRVLALIDTIRAEVTQEYYEDLDLIEEYVLANPEILLQDDPTASVPADVRAAYDRVVAVVEESHAGSELPEEEVVVGNRYVVTGTLAESEDKNSNLGTVYELDVDDLDVTLYFVFGGDVAVEVSETMVGEKVEVEVEITEVTDSGVTYRVVNGPTLLEDSE